MIDDVSLCLLGKEDILTDEMKIIIRVFIMYQSLVGVCPSIFYMTKYDCKWTNKEN